MSILGERSQEEMVKERDEEQFKRSLHQNHLQSGAIDDRDSNAAEILRILSDIEDLPIDPTEDEVLGQLISRLTSTANLSPEQVKSNEWVREYILLLYLCKHPPENGLEGFWGGWAHADPTMERAPLDPETRMMLESYVTSSKLALTRSEDFKAVEESTRTINESVVHDQSKEQGGGGGLLGRFTR